MNWTTERPTEPGYYVFKHAGCWPLWLVTVKMGNWQMSQNPAILYVAGLPTATANSDMRNGPLSGVHGKWYGPIPEPA